MDILKRNNVTISGTGQRPIVFAHGFIGDQTLWRHVASGFEDCRVILFDYVGCGNSDKNSYDKKKYARLEGYSQDLIDICETLELQDIVFVGHSISAMIGLIAAIRAPSYFRKLIFVAPSPRYINDINYYGGFEQEDIEKIIEKIDHDYSSWAKELPPIVVNKPEAPELAQELTDKLLTTDHRVTMNFAKATFFTDYRNQLLKLRIPSVILQCNEDVMAPIEVGEYLHAHLDNSILRRLNSKGHFPQLSAPDEVIKTIRDFLG